ncbi:MAG: hypothetical protein ACRDS9_12220 [Pseudonocardiaceae bacterium]
MRSSDEFHSRADAGLVGARRAPSSSRLNARLTARPRRAGTARPGPLTATSRETTAKIPRECADDRIIALGRGRIAVLDQDRLRRACGA